MKRETLILKAAVLLLAISVLALCAFGLPRLANDLAGQFPAHWFYPVLICMYAAAVPFFLALYQAFRLLGHIGREEAFTQPAEKALRRIKGCAFAVCFLYAAAVPFLSLMAEQEDAPGMLAFGLTVVFASFIMAVFASVLQRLCISAMRKKAP